MPYIKTPWVDNTTPAITAAQLNRMEDGIAAAGTPTATISVAAVDSGTNFRSTADYVCTGTADETTINTAIAALPPVGGVVVLGEGNYSINAPIVFQKDAAGLLGLVRGTTRLNQSASFTGSAILTVNRDDLVGANKRPVGSVTVGGFTIYGAYQGTQGTTDGIMFKGFRSDLKDVEVYSVNGHGIVVRGVTAAERGIGADWSCFGQLTNNCKVHDCGMGGILYDAASTDAAITHCEIYENAGPGFETGAVVNEVSSCYIWGNRDNSNGTSQGNGMVFTGGAGRCNIVNNKIEQNRTGIRLIAGSNFQIIGNVLASNSTALTGNTSTGPMPAGWYTTGATNQRDELSFEGAGGAPSEVLFVGNGVNPTAYGGDVSRYAINITSGTRILIAHNSIGSGTTGLLNYGVGGGNIITLTENFGLITDASGTGTITAAATNVVITHGLSGPPNIQDIAITPTISPTTDVGTWWVSAVGATTFTVNVRNAPGASTFTFGWHIKAVRFS